MSHKSILMKRELAFKCFHHKSMGSDKYIPESTGKTGLELE